MADKANNTIKMKVKLDAVNYDSEIYPRERWNTHTVQTYVDVLRAGGEFPAIVLEAETNRLIDGVHRWKAYQKYLKEYNEHKQQATLEGIELDEWAIASDEIEVVCVEIPDEIPPKLFAASFSTRHGDRIPRAQRKAIAREVYEENPDFTLKVLAQYLDISKSTAGDYTSDIRARRKEELKMTAYRLHRLGWTQEEIAESVGVAQNHFVRDFLHQFPGLEIGVKKLLKDGFSHTDIAERQNMPLILVWAIDLDGHTDAQRMGKKKLNIPIQPYDVWNFSICNPLFGAKYPGRIPGQLVAHVLYFFTDPGAMIIDPMAGSGTTLDVCLAMGRKCYGYDIASLQRSDVIEYDLSCTNDFTGYDGIYADQIMEGWPSRIKKADLIFWDPPYFEKKDKEYQEGSISALPRDEYLKFFADALSAAVKQVKKGTRLAFLMSDWDDNTGEQEGIFLWDYANLIQSSGWKLIRHIQVPLSTQQVHADIVLKFRKSRRLARLERYLLIGEKQ